MALVDYSSPSDEESEEAGQAIASEASHKRKRDSYDENINELPPLPSKFHDLYVSAVRVSTRDDPSLHKGRKRVTPHIEGNWPTHLYIEWYPASVKQDLLSSLITAINDQTVSGLGGGCAVNSLLVSDTGASLPLHISLSKPIGFTAGQKDKFLASLQTNIAGSDIRPFKISVGDLDWVSNFERTRWFLVLRLQRSEGDGLNKLLAVCNKTVKDHLQPPLYDGADLPVPFLLKGTGNFTKSLGKHDNSDMQTRKVHDFSEAFHISVGWSLEQPSSKTVDLLETLMKNETFETIKRTSLEVDVLKAKIGNIITRISLPSKVVEIGELFGS